MKSKQASKYFHGKEGFNCTQAVLKTFQPESGMSDFTIYSAQVTGGGRAEGGICGALYAAHILLDDGEHKDSVTQAFIQKTGSAFCADIKTSECNCRGFVEITAQLTSEHLDKIDKDDPDYVADRESREKRMIPKA